MQYTQLPSYQPFITWELDQVVADWISSSAGKLDLQGAVTVAESAPAIGNVVAVRVKEVNPNYPVLELPDGREIKLRAGEVLVGVLGIRKALRGFSGGPPKQLSKGHRLHLLNKGGIIGECTAFNRDLGWPTVVEYIGTVQEAGQNLNLKDSALPLVEGSLPPIPLIFVMGTCMNAGKTTVCAKILELFSERGFVVHAGKVAGVACQQDPVKMKKKGAAKVLTFHDFGLPSSAHVDDLAPVARSIVHHLAEGNPDFIVLEMGDGIIGGYQVASLFADSELMDAQVCTVLCANDLMGAWGALQWIRQNGGNAVNHPLLVSGAVTDSAEGIQFIEENWRVSAANAFDSAGKIGSFILENLMPWSESA